MNTAQRDELLIRIDERQKQLLDVNLLQEKHLSDLNAKVLLNVIKIASHDDKIFSIEKVLEQGVPVKFTRKQYAAGGSSLFIILSSLLIAIGKATCWW